jgi:hypothetical protein
MAEISMLVIGLILGIVIGQGGPIDDNPRSAGGTNRR